MGQLKHNISAPPEKLADAKPSFKAYNGPTPPKDIYKGVIRQLKVPAQKNKNGDYMIRGMVEIVEKDGSRKAKYNGYAIWFRQNISDQGAPYVNQMLDSISGGDAKYRAAFWKLFVATDENDKVTKIGGKRYADGVLEVVVAAKDGQDQHGARQLEIGAWLTSTEAENFESDAGTSDDEDDEDDVELEIEDEDEDESEDEETDDEDEDEEEAEEDGDEDDEDEAEEDEGAARREELTAMTRPELVALARELKIKVLKSKSVEDYINEILEAEDDEPPF